MSWNGAPLRRPPLEWPKNSQLDEYYIIDEGMYELLFSSQQPKAKDFRRHCCNVMFPQTWQQLSDKLHAMEIEDLTNRVQALEFTNEEEFQTHQQSIEENDAALALLNDDLKHREYENVALQAQRDMYQAELQRCQDTITHLRTRYLDHARDPGKGNIIIILWKHASPANDKYHDLPYYIARIQRRKRYFKLRSFDRHFPDYEVIVEIDNPNSIHAFNRFEEEGHAEWK